MYLAVNERGLPAKSIVTDGTRADCKEAVKLLKNIDVKLLFADHAYDNNEILYYIARRNIKSVIHQKRNKLEQRDYNCKLYRYRHIIENTFLAFVSAVLPPDTLKRSMLSSLLFMFVVSLCICHSFKFFSCRQYLKK